MSPIALKAQFFCFLVKITHRRKNGRKFSLPQIFNMQTHSVLDENFWNQRYLEHQTGWDIGYPSTPLKSFAEGLTEKKISILIPGCGNAYEAEHLINSGFTDITLLDISPVLTAALQEKFSELPIRIVTGDFFLHEGQYDLILEQTFFCAID